MVKYVRDVAAAVPRDGPLGNAELHYGSRMSAAETAISIVSMFQQAQHGVSNVVM